ncbi:MAG: putative lipid II flippase FtsW [Patescibacteria group bacterium]
MRAHSSDKWLIGLLIAFVLLGLFMVFNASSTRALIVKNDPFFYFKKQLAYLGLGLIGFWLAFKIKHKLWQKFSFLILVLGFGLISAVFIPGIGSTLQGATRWLNLGPVSIQPAEFFKISLIIYLASFFSKRQAPTKINSFLETALPFLVILGLFGGILLSQKSFGMLAIITGIALAIYFASGVSLKNLFQLAVPLALIMIFFLLSAPYRVERLKTFLQPEQDPLGSGYQINQALISIGSGGISGVGLGHSRQKFNFLPETMGDSIFAIWAEETGFIGSAGLLTLIGIFFIRGFRISRMSRDMFSKLLAFGITFAITFQFLFNIAAISNLIPLSGIPLPFFSYGGSSLISTLIMYGVLLNISKYTVKTKT